MAKSDEGEDLPWSSEVEAARRVPMSVRTTPMLRARIEKSARESGRSLAQEVEFRLEQSLRDDDKFKQIQGQMEFIQRVLKTIGDGQTGDLMMKLARGISEIEASQGVDWCKPQADLSAYDINLKDIMEGIRRIWCNRERATISDYMALEHPFLSKYPTKMVDD